MFVRKATAVETARYRCHMKARFDIIKVLGEGSYGKVKLATDKQTGQKVAIKCINKSKISGDGDLTRIRREINILASLEHKNVIQIYEVYENRERILIVMEYAGGGDLYDYVNSRDRLTEKEARKLFRQIVSAVHHLHVNGVVHRDLKLENVLLDRNGNVKLADFGLSNMWHEDYLLHTFCGSPLYASPEIVNGQSYYGPEVDCWSLGVLLYALVYGAMPFDGSDFHKLKKQITTGDYYEPAKQCEASELIEQLLTVNPVERANVADAASHWWTNKGNSILIDELCAEDDGDSSSDYYEDDGVFCDSSKVSISERNMTAVFDSSKMPKKSILKKRNISSGDSGCALSDNKDNERSMSEIQCSLGNDCSQTTVPGDRINEHFTKDKLTTSSISCCVQESQRRNSALSSTSSIETDFGYESPSEST